MSELSEERIREIIQEEIGKEQQRQQEFICQMAITASKTLKKISDETKKIRQQIHKEPIFP